jgi:uncharacterized Zn-finger protein
MTDSTNVSFSINKEDDFNTSDYEFEKLLQKKTKSRFDKNSNSEGVKMFFCKNCGGDFSTKGNLQVHVLTIHENKRPFKCTFEGCTKGYSNKSRLMIHMNIHVNFIIKF